MPLYMITNLNTFNLYIYISIADMHKFLSYSKPQIISIIILDKKPAIIYNEKYLLQFL